MKYKINGYDMGPLTLNHVVEASSMDCEKKEPEIRSRAALAFFGPYILHKQFAQRTVPPLLEGRRLNCQQQQKKKQTHEPSVQDEEPRDQSTIFTPEIKSKIMKKP